VHNATEKSNGRACYSTYNFCELFAHKISIKLPRITIKGAFSCRCFNHAISKVKIIIVHNASEKSNGKACYSTNNFGNYSHIKSVSN